MISLSVCSEIIEMHRNKVNVECVVEKISNTICNKMSHIPNIEFLSYSVYID